MLSCNKMHSFKVMRSVGFRQMYAPLSQIKTEHFHHVQKLLSPSRHPPCPRKPVMFFLWPWISCVCFVTDLHTSCVLLHLACFCSVCFWNQSSFFHVSVHSLCYGAAFPCTDGPQCGHPRLGIWYLSLSTLTAHFPQPVEISCLVSWPLPTVPFLLDIQVLFNWTIFIMPSFTLGSLGYCTDITTHQVILPH